MTYLPPRSRSNSLFRRSPASTSPAAGLLAFGAAIALLMSTPIAGSAQSLRVAHASDGLSSIHFAGHEYLAKALPSVHGVRVLDAEGNPQAVSSSPSSQSFDPATKMHKQTYEWGTVEIAFTANDNRLDARTRITNTGTSTIHQLEVRLLDLSFPDWPQGHTWRQNRNWNDNGDGPTVVPARMENALVVMTNEVVDRTLRSGFRDLNSDHKTTTLFFRTGGEAAEFATIPSGERALVHARGDSRVRDRANRNFLDGMTLHRPIEPGEHETFHLSLRFDKPDSDFVYVASDIYERYRQAFPATLEWPDRRPITTAFLSSPAEQHKSETNPRGWLNDKAIDVTTEEGIAAFHTRMLDFADRCIAGAQNLNAQGIIVWDVEGQEMPHPISYIGDPRMLPEMAPEMDVIADEFFARLNDAGLHSGITIRPTVVSKDPKNPERYRHSYGLDMTGDQFIERISAKVAYAVDRWNITMVYIDTNIIYRPDRDGKWESQLMSPDFMRQLNERFPEVLFVPEFGVSAYHGYVAPYAELRPHYWGNVAATSHHARAIYPEGFTVVNVADSPIDNRWNDLVEGIRGGDSLMIRSWWSGQGEHDKVRAIYKEAASE